MPNIPLQKMLEKLRVHCRHAAPPAFQLAPALCCCPAPWTAWCLRCGAVHGRDGAVAPGHGPGSGSSATPAGRGPPPRGQACAAPPCAARTPLRTRVRAPGRRWRARTRRAARWWCGGPCRGTAGRRWGRTWSWRGRQGCGCRVWWKALRGRWKGTLRGCRGAWMRRWRRSGSSGGCWRREGSKGVVGVGQWMRERARHRPRRRRRQARE